MPPLEKECALPAMCFACSRALLSGWLAEFCKFAFPENEWLLARRQHFCWIMLQRRYHVAACSAYCNASVLKERMEYIIKYLRSAS
jgi:hypothetical protein